MRAELPAYAAAGWLTPAEPFALGSMRARRMAREYAGATSRRAGRRRGRSREYEAYATSLAFLRHRGRRGAGGPGLRRTGAGAAAPAVAAPGGRRPGPDVRGAVRRDAPRSRRAAAAVPPPADGVSVAPVTRAAPALRRLQPVPPAGRAQPGTGPGRYRPGSDRRHPVRHHPGVRRRQHRARTAGSATWRYLGQAARLRAGGRLGELRQLLLGQRQVRHRHQRGQLLDRARGGDRRGDGRPGGEPGQGDRGELRAVRLRRSCRGRRAPCRPRSGSRCLPAPAARALSTVVPGRYLPVRKPEARAKYGTAASPAPAARSRSAPS